MNKITLKQRAEEVTQTKKTKVKLLYAKIRS